MPPALNGQWAFSPVLTEILRSRQARQRASNFLCLHKESHQRNAPLGVALRASRERSAYGKAVPTQHPCCDGTE